MIIIIITLTVLLCLGRVRRLHKYFCPELPLYSSPAARQSRASCKSPPNYTCTRLLRSLDRRRSISDSAPILFNAQPVEDNATSVTWLWLPREFGIHITFRYILKRYLKGLLFYIAFTNIQTNH